MNLLELMAFACNEGEKDGIEFDVLYKGSKVAYLNEAGRLDWDTSKFFVAGFEFGARVVVHVESYRGDGFETAWSAWRDSMDPIPDEELIEAYAPSNDSGSFLDEAIDAYPGRGEGRWTDEDWSTIRSNARAALDTMVKAARETGTYPEIVEGYEMRDDGQIVEVGHYAWMNEADLEDIEIVRRGP